MDLNIIFIYFGNEILFTKITFMYNNIIEILRKKVIEDIFKTKTIQKCWPIWNGIIKEKLPNNVREQNILNLGDHLSEIFKSTGGRGRGQNDLAAGGTAWEALVVWYINLCCVGTRVVAFKKMNQVPLPIKEAITVSYENFSCSTESDITIVVFPDNPIFIDADNIPLFLTKRGKIIKEKIDNQVGDHFLAFNVGIVQCKTNWNDNAQIPMLWDMIYSAGGFRGRQISVGINNFSIQSLNSFSYSFATVPSNKLELFKPTSTSVMRVRGLSGGNYWGRPSKDAIARSIKEIFKNYSIGYIRGDIRSSLKIALPHLKEGEELDFFNLY